MATKIGDMAVYISASTAGLARDLARGAGMVQSFAGTVNKTMALAAKPITAFASFGRDIAAVAGGNLLASSIRQAAGGLGGLLTDSVSLAAEMEKTTVAFEVLTGSAEKTRDLMKEIKSFAADSPLSLSQASGQVKKLLAAGVSSEQAVPTVARLSDLSVGDPAILERLSYAYGQVRAAGRLYGTELRQFTETGIPLMEELGKVIGKQKEEVKKYVEDGKVGFYELQLAVKGLTDKGGKFYGMTEKYAGTLAGKWERAKDGFDELKRAFGTAIIEEVGLKEAAGDLENFADSFKPVVEAIRPLIRFVGDLGKGLAQLAGEGGKAFINIADIVGNRLGKAFPETIKSIQGAVAAIKDFKLDPEGIANFAVSIGDGIISGLKSAKPYWDAFVDDFVTPIKDAFADAKRLRQIASRPFTEVGAEIFGQRDAVRKADAVADALAAEERRAQRNKDKYGLGMADAYALSSYEDLRTRAKRDNDLLMRAGANAEIGKILKRGDPTAVVSGFDKMIFDRRAVGVGGGGNKGGSAGDAFRPDTPGLDATLAERFQNPAKKLADDLALLSRYRDQGRVTPDTYALAVADTLREAGQHAGLGANQLAAGVELGSQQLATMVAQAGVGNGPNSVEGLLKMLTDLAAQQLDAAKQLVNNTGQRPVVVTAPE